MTKNLTNLLGQSLLAVGLILAVSCGPKPASDSAATTTSTPTATADGPSARLTKLDGAPAFSVDKLGDAAGSATGRAPISSGGPLVVNGWAVDRADKISAGGVDIVIDGNAYAAKYGTPRADVAAHFQIPAYAASGYSFSTPAAAFDKGAHKLTVRVINSGKTGYWESVALPFEIR